MEFCSTFCPRFSAFGTLPLSPAAMIAKKRKVIIKDVLNSLISVRTSQRPSQPFIPGERTFSIVYHCYFIIPLSQIVNFSRSSCQYRFVRDLTVVLQSYLTGSWVWHIMSCEQFVFWLWNNYAPRLCLVVTLLCLLLFAFQRSIVVFLFSLLFDNICQRFIIFWSCIGRL